MAKRKTGAKRKERQTTANISMPASLREYVEERLNDGFGNVSEYFRHLVREDLERRRRRFAELIEEGERSGPPIVADEKFWESLHQLARTAAKSRVRTAG